MGKAASTNVPPTLRLDLSNDVSWMKKDQTCQVRCYYAWGKVPTEPCTHHVMGTWGPCIIPHPGYYDRFVKRWPEVVSDRPTFDTVYLPESLMLDHRAWVRDQDVWDFYDNQ